MPTRKNTPPRIRIGPHTLGGRELVYFLGPCVIESEKMAWSLARRLQKMADQLGIAWVFKASYDKANRTSVHSFRGPGLAEGTRILGEIRRELALPILTDIHTPTEAEVAAQAADILQIPAFLCRQTDLLRAAAETGKVINVKKGQFLSPSDVAAIAEKLDHFGVRHSFFTERGTSFGYQNLVVDMRSIPWIQQQGHRIVFDATHSVQRPGGLGSATGGDRDMAPVLARAAVAAGCDGVFMETHPQPEHALSDGPNQIPTRRLASVIKVLQSIRHATSL